VTDLGDIRVGLVADTAKFDAAMKSSAGSMDLASKAAAGVVGGVAMLTTGAMACAAASIALVKNVAGLGDSAAKSASKMGTTAEVVQELQHAAELSGSTIVDVEKAFGRLNKNAQAAADGTAASVKAFERIGVATRDANGQLKDSETLFMESAQAISEMANGTQQAAAAQEIFGKSGTKLLPMLKAGSAGIAEMRQEARDLGIVMSNDAAATSERFNDTLDRLNKSFEGVKTTVGVALLPAFTALADTALSLTRQFFQNVDVASYMQQGLKYLTEGALSLIRTMIEFAPVLAGVATAMRVASNVGQVWLEGLFVIGKLIGGLAATIAQFVTGALSGFVGGVSEVAVALGEDELAGSLRKAERGIADVADTMGQLSTAAFDSLGDSVNSIAGDFGDIDSAVSDLADGSSSQALRDVLGTIEGAVQSIGSATLDTANTFESGADRMVTAAKKVESALKEVALGYADVFLAEQQQGRDVGQARAREENRISTGFGAALAEVEGGNRAAALGTSGPSTAGPAAEALGQVAQSSQLLSGALSVLQGGVMGLVGPFVKLWTSSESMAKVFALIDTLMAPMQRFVDMVGNQLLKVLEPVAKVFEALGPVMDVFLMALNPIILPLKAIAALFEALAKPIDALLLAIKFAVNGIRVAIINIGRKDENKAYVDEKGRIVDPTGKRAVQVYIDFDDEVESATGELAKFNEGVQLATDELAKIPVHVQKMSDQMAAAGREFAERMGVFVDPLFSFGMGAGQTDVWGSFHEQIGRVTTGFEGVADVSREVSASLTNVPEIFRRNLRAAQVSPGVAGGLAGGSSSGVYVAGNVIVTGGNLDEFSQNLQRQRFVRTGETYTGMAAMSGLAAAG